MKLTANTCQLVPELRKVIRKSQAQFAAMIGVSKHAIISVENGRTKTVTKNLAKRIEIATGADLLNGKLQSPFTVANYTRADFDRWRDKYGQTNKAAAVKQFDEMKAWLKVVFVAAAKAGRAGNRDRLPALSLSLAEWLNEARVNFKLEDEIEDVLDDETRRLKVVAHSISHLLKHPDASNKQLAEHGIEFSKIRKELKKHAFHGWLFIQDEYRSLWNPGGHPYEVPASPRTLIPHAKYWIKEFRGSLSALKECGDSHPELTQYLKSIDPENPSAPPSKKT